MLLKRNSNDQIDYSIKPRQNGKMSTSIDRLIVKKIPELKIGDQFNKNGEDSVSIRSKTKSRVLSIISKQENEIKMMDI